MLGLEKRHQAELQSDCKECFSFVAILEITGETNIPLIVKRVYFNNIRHNHTGIVNAAYLAVKFLGFFSGSEIANFYAKHRCDVGHVATLAGEFPNKINLALRSLCTVITVVYLNAKSLCTMNSAAVTAIRIGSGTAATTAAATVSA